MKNEEWGYYLVLSYKCCLYS